MSDTPVPPAPSSPPSSPSRSRLPWIVGGVVVLVLALVVVVVLTRGGTKEAADARSVQDVADAAVAAAEDLDLEKGIDLLCEAPTALQRDLIEQLIADGRDRAGTDDPDVDYAISDVDGDAEGTFKVTISSDDTGLEDTEATFTLAVGTDGDRSCVDAEKTFTSQDDD